MRVADDLHVDAVCRKYFVFESEIFQHTFYTTHNTPGVTSSLRPAVVACAGRCGAMTVLVMGWGTGGTWGYDVALGLGKCIHRGCDHGGRSPTREIQDRKQVYDLSRGRMGHKLTEHFRLVLLNQCVFTPNDHVFNRKWPYCNGNWRLS